MVVLEGDGASFSAGADLNWMRGMAAASEADNRDDALALARLMRTLDELPKPTIARVHGAAFGGGVGLVACCDIAIGVARSQVRPDRKQARPAAGGDLALRDRRHRRAPGAALVRHRRDLRRRTKRTAIGLLHQVVADRAALDAAVQRQIDLLLQGRPGRRGVGKALVPRRRRRDRDALDDANAA